MPRSGFSNALGVGVRASTTGVGGHPSADRRMSGALGRRARQRMSYWLLLFAAGTQTNALGDRGLGTALGCTLGLEATAHDVAHDSCKSLGLGLFSS
jgi:hypothetical protein